MLFRSLADERVERTKPRREPPAGGLRLEIGRGASGVRRLGVEHRPQGVRDLLALLLRRLLDPDVGAAEQALIDRLLPQCVGFPGIGRDPGG